jgi:hypothetical protein
MLPSNPRAREVFSVVIGIVATWGKELPAAFDRRALNPRVEF